jgi:hypothetical protein
MNGKNFKSGSSGSLGTFASLGGGNMNLGKENPYFTTLLTMCGTCTISDSARGGGSSLTWWPTTFVTCQLLVPSPT